MGKDTRLKTKGTPVECSDCGAIVTVSQTKPPVRDIICPAITGGEGFDIPEYCKNQTTHTKY